MGIAALLTERAHGALYFLFSIEENSCLSHMLYNETVFRLGSAIRSIYIYIYKYLENKTCGRHMNNFLSLIQWSFSDLLQERIGGLILRMNKNMTF